MKERETEIDGVVTVKIQSVTDEFFRPREKGDMVDDELEIRGIEEINGIPLRT